ncbi:MAG: VWA domain-containing protein [Acidobacteriota bacterium]|nr:VWA domain-containing protein [Acidobacteriota bacterium]
MKIFITVFLTLFFAFSVFSQKQAEVIVTLTYMRKAPDLSSEKVQTVLKGEKLTLEKNQETNGWYYVSISNRTVKGWIRKDTISPAVSVRTVIERPQRVVSIPPSASGKTPTISKTSTAGKIPTASKTPTVNQAPAPANAPVEEEEIIRIDTEEVKLNVRVVDANNRAVKNLNQSSFKVYEDDVLQPINSLTMTEIPMINALLIDNSRSLRSQLKNIIEAGKILVVKNRSTDESAVIRFVSADKIEVVQDFTLNKTSLIQGLDNLFVEGGQTALIDAVYFAAKKIDQYQNPAQKDDVSLRALILITDGDDRNSSHNEEQLFELLRRSQVQIYAVGFVNNLSKEPDASGTNRQEKAKTFLNRLAQETGGKVYFPSSIDELPQIASDISGELHTQYSIAYAPTNDKRDGTFRKIKVLIDDGTNNEKRIAITRTGRTSAAK